MVVRKKLLTHKNAMPNTVILSLCHPILVWVVFRGLPSLHYTDVHDFFV